uniref:BTB domain-containing protein n=1 Tax=Panagrellus redivivus TaxID=6233 RepID=A0A7E4V607_PANRE
MHTVKVVKDSTTFTLYEADLLKRRIGVGLETRERKVPHSEAIYWRINYRPAGLNLKYLGHVGVYLCVNQYVKAKYTFAIDGFPFYRSQTHEFNEQYVSGYHKFAPHPFLRRFFRDGKLTIKCNVEFFLDVEFYYNRPRMVYGIESVPTDFDFVVGTKRLHVHKSVLSQISPVFHAMLFHDTAESRSGEVVITDFDFDTVKAAIDYCYGRNIQNSVNTYIQILRFADKYDIKDVVSKLEYIPSRFNLSIKTFYSIVLYAYDYSKDDLLIECCAFFKFNQIEIKANAKFAKLPPRLIARLLRAGDGKRTEFVRLSFAYENGRTSLVEQLERPLIEFMTMGDFYLAVYVAWLNSRDELKKACARFFNANMNKIFDSDCNAYLKKTHLVPPETVSEADGLPPRHLRKQIFGKKRRRAASASRVGFEIPPLEPKPRYTVNSTIHEKLPYRIFHELSKIGRGLKKSSS